MTNEQKYALWEYRLNKLVNRIDKENHGACRKVRREMRNLKVTESTEE